MYVYTKIWSPHPVTLSLNNCFGELRRVNLFLVLLAGSTLESFLWVFFDNACFCPPFPIECARIVVVEYSRMVLKRCFRHSHLAHSIVVWVLFQDSSQLTGYFCFASSSLEPLLRNMCFFKLVLRNFRLGLLPGDVALDVHTGFGRQRSHHCDPSSFAQNKHWTEMHLSLTYSIPKIWRNSRMNSNKHTMHVGWGIRSGNDYPW